MTCDRMRRRGAFLAATSLSVSLLCGDLAPAANAADGAVTPPARVGRVAATGGSVSFHAAGTDGWQDAVVNTPVTTGDAVFAQTGGHVELDVAHSIVALDSASELDVATLDDTHFQTSEPQGRIFVDLGQLPAGAVTAVATPRGTVTFDGPGEFEITAGDTTTPTIVTAIAGTARITAGALALAVQAGQAATVTGTDQLAGSVGPAGPPDDFLDASLAATARLQGNTLPPLVQGMTGGRALAATGTWRAVPQYGQVWYPPVAAGWVPYREGHWAYVAPWGWTWIDDAPWGFAPFHYGRWVYLDDRWGWVPGDPSTAAGYDGPEYDGYPEPVYAPALVAWGDFGAGLAVGAFAGALFGGGHGPGVGWLPLGPGEAYVPPYGGGGTYFDRLNALNVRDVRGLDPRRAYAGRSFGQFANARGATLMATADMQRGVNARTGGGGFSRAALGASPVVGRHVVGVPAAGRVAGHAASGPALDAANFHARAGGRIAFAGGGVAGVHAGPGAGGLPALRAHDAVVGGRPGAVPEGMRGGEGVGHAGMISGLAAGAAGAGLAAHAIGSHIAAARPGSAPGHAGALHAGALHAGALHGGVEHVGDARGLPVIHDRAVNGGHDGAVHGGAPARGMPVVHEGAARGGGAPGIPIGARPVIQRPSGERFAAPRASFGPRAPAGGGARLGAGVPPIGGSGGGFRPGGGVPPGGGAHAGGGARPAAGGGQPPHR